MWQDFIFTNFTNDKAAIDKYTKDNITKEKTAKDLAAEGLFMTDYVLNDDFMRVRPATESGPSDVLNEDVKCPAIPNTRTETGEDKAGAAEFTTAESAAGNDTDNTKAMASKKSSKPYDDVFRTLVNDCDSLVLPVLNEVFGEHYTGEEEIVHSRNEHYINRQGGETQERITDSCFKVIGEETKNYLFECQSTPDSSMLVRIFEYATQIALDERKKDKDKRTVTLEVSIPHAAVLYLRSTESTPDRMHMKINSPEGDGIVCDIPTVKIRDYSLDDIFDRNLLFLIPFYIFNYGTRKQLEEMEEDEGKLEVLKGDYRRIVERLNKLADEGRLSAFYRMTLLEMSGNVVDGVAANYERIREGVRNIMGGTVLEYKAKTILREGYSKGESAGYSKGESAGEINKAQKTAKRLFMMNMPVQQIAEAVEVDVSQVNEWVL